MNERKNTILNPLELLLLRVNWVPPSTYGCASGSGKLSSAEDQPKVLSLLAHFSSLVSSLLPL